MAVKRTCERHMAVLAFDPGSGTWPAAAAGTRAAGTVRAGTRPPHPVLAQPHLPDRARALRAVGGHAVRTGHRAAHVAGLAVQRGGARRRPDDDRTRRRPCAGGGQRGGPAPWRPWDRPAGWHPAHHRPGERGALGAAHSRARRAGRLPRSDLRARRALHRRQAPAPPRRPRVRPDHQRDPACRPSVSTPSNWTRATRSRSTPPCPHLYWNATGQEVRAIWAVVHGQPGLA